MKETILKTREVTIGGKRVTVEQIHGGKHRQDIFYRIDGVDYTTDQFFAMKPSW